MQRQAFHHAWASPIPHFLKNKSSLTSKIQSTPPPYEWISSACLFKNQRSTAEKSVHASTGKHSLVWNPQQGFTKLCISARSCKTGKRNKVIPINSFMLTLTHDQTRARQTKSSLNRVTFRFRNVLRSELKDEQSPNHYGEFQDQYYMKVKFLIHRCSQLQLEPI